MENMVSSRRVVPAAHFFFLCANMSGKNVYLPRKIFGVECDSQPAVTVRELYDIEPIR